MGSIVAKIKSGCREMRGYFLFGHRVGVFGKVVVKYPKNVLVGKGCRINDGVFILGFSSIEIGNNVVLSANCMLLDAGLDLDVFKGAVNPPHVSMPVKVGDGAWIGAGAIILPGVVVGEKSVVASGSVVTRDVPAFCIVAGNPAKVIRRM